MKRPLSVIVALGLAAAFGTPGIAAQRPGAVVSAKATGLSETRYQIGPLVSCTGKSTIGRT
jgi:hypothetical protein